MTDNPISPLRLRMIEDMTVRGLPRQPVIRGAAPAPWPLGKGL